jgi:hypothetical protein
MLGKLKIEDPNAYKNMMKTLNANISKKEYESAKKFFETK